jgi:hypothetical protein
MEKETPTESQKHVCQILTANSVSPWFAHKIEPSSYPGKASMKVFRQGYFSYNGAHYTYKENVGTLLFTMDEVRLATIQEEPWMKTTREEVKTIAEAFAETVHHYARENIGTKICPLIGERKLSTPWPH